MFLKILSVAALASFEIYAAIPTGFAFQLHAFGLSPWIIFIASAAGGLAGLFIAAFLGDRIRKFFTRKKKKETVAKKTGLGYRIWNKYGTIGLGFFGTLTVGAPASMALGLGMNGSLPKLIASSCLQ